MRGGPRMEVRRAEPAELDRVAQVLGDAFADYAWTRWTVDPNDHHDRVTQLQRLALAHWGFPFGQVWVNVVHGGIQSVAVWMDSAIEVPTTVQALVRPAIVDLEGSRHEASLRAQQEVDDWRPGQRHYFLATTGTIPPMQGCGLATATLAPVLSRADEEGVDAFLETSSAGNRTFYRKLGFEVVDHRRISDGGPDVWSMLRRPQRG